MRKRGSETKRQMRGGGKREGRAECFLVGGVLVSALPVQLLHLDENVLKKVFDRSSASAVDHETRTMTSDGQFHSRVAA